MAWTDLSFSFEQVLTSDDMNNMDANFDALAGQESGAPNLQVRDGTAASPGLPFRDDANTGVFRPAADVFAVSAGGSEGLRVDGTEIQDHGTPVLNDNDLAANGGSVPETDRGNTFIKGQSVGASGARAFNVIDNTSSPFVSIRGADNGDGGILLGGATNEIEAGIIHRAGAELGRLGFRSGGNNDRGHFDADGGFVVGAPTGSSQGAGTLNGEALYDNGNRVVSDSNPATASEIAAGAVGQSEVAASAIGQGELKTTTGTISTTDNNSGPITSIKTLPGGQYGFYPRAKWTADTSGSSVDKEAAIFYGDGDEITVDDNFPRIDYDKNSTSSFSSSYASRVGMRANRSGTGTAVTITVQQRYVQASPPYDLGDGECGLFIEADIYTNGEQLGLYVAPDPVWANNGPTDIRPDYIDRATGKAYKRIRRPAVSRADLDTGRADMADYLAAQREAPVEDVEVDAAFKNADMDLFPHSWVSPPQGTICLLDPVNTHDLLMLHEAGEDVADLIHKGYVQIGDEVKRKGPPGVVPVTWKWKKS